MTELSFTGNPVSGSDDPKGGVVSSNGPMFGLRLLVND